MRRPSHLLFLALLQLGLCVLAAGICRAAEPPLRYWFWWEAPTFDTYRGDSFDVMQVARNIYAPLVSIGLDGVPQGMIAENWSVNRSGQVWRFLIRKGLTYESGKPITPDSVLKNFTRMLWLTRGEKLPLNALLPGLKTWTGPPTPLKSVRVENGYLVFRFNRRPDNLFEILSHPVYGAADPECFDDGGRWLDPFCRGASGPYSVSARSPGKIVLKYRGQHPASRAAPESVELRTPGTSGESAMESMLSGEGDLTVQPDFAIGPETRRRLKEGGLLFTEEPPSRMYFFQLNHARPPFNDQKLRRSIRDMFLQLLSKEPYFLDRGKVEPSFLPKGAVGYSEFPAGAGAALRKSDGVVELMLYPLANYAAAEDSDMQAAAENAFIKTLRLHGLTPVISRYTDRRAFRRRNEEMKFDALLRGSGVVVNDPYSGLMAMFMSRISALLPDPSGRASARIEEAGAAERPERKRALLKMMNEAVYEDAALITFAHSSWVYIHKPGVDMSRFNLFMDPVEFRAIGWNP